MAHDLLSAKSEISLSRSVKKNWKRIWIHASMSFKKCLQIFVLVKNVLDEMVARVPEMGKSSPSVNILFIFIKFLFIYEKIKHLKVIFPGLIEPSFSIWTSCWDKCKLSRELFSWLMVKFNNLSISIQTEKCIFVNYFIEK